MITLHSEGSIFDSSAQTLVNPVNCVGVMGKGLAAEFRRRYPLMHEMYQRQCAVKALLPGQPVLYAGQNPWIVCFPTKQHWRDVSKLVDIDVGLAVLAEQVVRWEVLSLAVPALGCGLGGLGWTDVWALIRKHLEPLSIPVDVYMPQKS